MTLAFLGDVQDIDLNRVCKAVAAACEPFAPLELKPQGVGAFPAPRGRACSGSGWLRWPDPLSTSFRKPSPAP